MKREHLEILQSYGISNTVDKVNFIRLENSTIAVVTTTTNFIVSGENCNELVALEDAVRKLVDLEVYFVHQNLPIIQPVTLYDVIDKICYNAFKYEEYKIAILTSDDDGIISIANEIVHRLKVYINRNKGIKLILKNGSFIDALNCSDYQTAISNYAGYEWDMIFFHGNNISTASKKFLLHNLRSTKYEPFYIDNIECT